jgi:hypothetical protein
MASSAPLLSRTFVLELLAHLESKLASLEKPTNLEHYVRKRRQKKIKERNEKIAAIRWDLEVKIEITKAYLNNNILPD